MIKVFLTVKTEEEQKQLLKAIHKVNGQFTINANMQPLFSTVYNKKEGKANLEYGYKVTLLHDDISDYCLINWWLTIKLRSSINCIWVDKDNYHGCICELPEYKNNFGKYSDHKITCSEY